MHISDGTLTRLLHDSGVATDDQIAALKEKQVTNHEPLQTLALSDGLISEKSLMQKYAASIDAPYVEVDPHELTPELLALIPEQVARQYNAVVFKQENGVAYVATDDPEDIQAVEFLKKQLGGNTQIYMTTHDNILRALDAYGGDVDEKLNEAIETQAGTATSADAYESGVSEEDVREDSPTAKTVNLLIEYAVRSGASDIHIEPTEDGIQIRYRIDGVLKVANQLPKHVLGAIVSRIKILASLKIDERRVPQDGRFKISVGGRTFAIRVSTLPVTEGEKVVMRILDESNRAVNLHDLGYWGHSKQALTNAMLQPNGMILVTGPTGSGKSTSLFSVLTQLNQPSVNISTVEDPVEYRVKGVNQTQVNPKAGMTFASGLRALLRQDPNIIMVGEIRDRETADLAVQAALTGHLVLTTLHTNNAATTLPRLLDMGIEPFLIASTMRTIIGQRLVRQLDKATRIPYSPSVVEQDALLKTFHLTRDSLPSIHALEKQAKSEGIGDDLPLSTDETGIRMLYKPHIKPDSISPGNGYQGRIGIYEAIENSAAIQQLIVGSGTSDSIEQQAIREGTVTMQIDGLIKALRGLTSIEEVLRVTRA